MSQPASEVQRHADFSAIRYAQVWEDADILLAGLAVQPGDTCLSIASAGDNVLALLTRDPANVIALDLNPAQLACLELRVAAYRVLSHAELLQLIGSRSADGERRMGLYQRCRRLLCPTVQTWWDRHPELIRTGVGSAGKFERYFALFRRRVLPLIHSRATIAALLEPRDSVGRGAFYAKVWNSWRWRLLFHIFFSRFVMGRLGRDPAFFRYVEGSVAERILSRTKHALTELDPSKNPYLTWILTETHGAALPLALRPENFERIRANLDRLEWHCASVEEFCGHYRGPPIARMNLSDIFEYMSEPHYRVLLESALAVAAPGGRLAYWNMLVPRSRPEALAHRLRPCVAESKELFLQDKAFFYSAFVVEEVLA